MNGLNGFNINGTSPGDNSGIYNGGGYDINHDGRADMFINAPAANNNTGESYVIYGINRDFPQFFNLGALSGLNGFTINGINQTQQLAAIQETQDVNGDGIDDLILATNTIGPGVGGEYYVIFGGNSEFSSGEFNVAGLNGNNGFTLGNAIPESGTCCYFSSISGGESLKGTKNTGFVAIGDPFNGAGKVHVIYSLSDQVVAEGCVNSMHDSYLDI